MKDLRDPSQKFVQFPRPSSGGNRTPSRRMRMIGEPFEFIQYSNRKRIIDPNARYGRRVSSDMVPFPDAATNRSFFRRGGIGDENCVWNQLGYTPSYSAATIVIEEDENNLFWLPKILVKGQSFWRQIQEIEDDAKIHNYNFLLNGLDSPSFYVTSHSSFGSPIYEYQVHLSEVKILPEEVAAEFVNMYDLPAIFAPHTL